MPDDAQPTEPHQSGAYSMGFIPGMQEWFNIHKLINMIYNVNKMESGNVMIISIGATKAFGKIQHLFIIKIVNKMCKERKYFSIINAIYDN